jgi:hypothetical protein
MRRIILGLACALLVRMAAAQTPVGTLPPIQWQRFVDPNEASFAMDVPAGWRVSGGLARRNALQFWPWLSAVSPDGNTILAFGNPNLQSYVLPTPMLAMAGLREGSIYNGGGGTYYLVGRYVPGLVFAKLLAQQQLPRFCNEIQAGASAERPEAAARIGDAFGGFAQTTAGDARFSCRKGGMELEADVFCATSLIPSPMVGPGAGLWYPSFLFAWLAPRPLAAVVEQMVAHMLHTIAVSPAWLARTSDTALAVSRIATASGQAVSDSIMRGWEAKNATIDPIMEEGSRARLGIDIYADPATGTRYTVENTYRHYWVNPEGRVVGTDTDTPPAGFQRLNRVPSNG